MTNAIVARAVQDGECLVLRQTRRAIVKVAGRTRTAARVVWDIEYGPIPDGKFVLHRCDNPLCVRPDHLFLGDQRVNMTDKASKGRGSVGRGERHGRAKMTDAQIAEMRELRASGLTYRELAERYGMSHDGVRFILVGRRRAL